MLLIILLVLILLCLLIALMFFIVTYTVFKNSYGRFAVDPDVSEYLYDHYREKYKREEFDFPSNDETLHGYLYGKENEKALLVFSHGIWSGHEQYLGIITYFIDKGYRVFAYDYMGYGKSTGSDSGGLPESPIDLNSAINFVKGNDEIIKKKDGSDLKILTCGHSWGAYASTAVLNLNDNVSGAAALSGFNDCITVSVETGKLMMGPAAVLMKPFVSLLNKMRYGELSNLKASDGINRSNIPVLITHADKDDFISYDVSSIICHKDEIKNSAVSYYTVTEEPRNNHNDFFLTKEAAAETIRIRNGFSELSKKYKKGEVPREVRHEYYNNIDKEKANKPCIEFFDIINDFFEKNVLW